MTDTNRCQSCSMTIENGTYCKYCSDDRGSLLAFEETLERFIQFAMQHRSDLDRPTAARQALEFMAKMPAWRDHPDLATARGGS